MSSRNEKPPAKRPTVATAPSFSKPTTSSVSRIHPTSNANKPMPRPGASTGTRGPAGGTPGTPVAKPTHRAQPSTSSTDAVKTSSMAAPSKKVTKIEGASIQSPAMKRPTSAPGKKITPASQSNNTTKNVTGRAGTASPTKMIQKPSKNPGTPMDPVKSTEHHTAEPAVSSPEPIGTQTPTSADVSRHGTPLATTKTRPSSAGYSPPPGTHMVKPAEKPATEPVVSSPRTTQTPTPTKARSSKLDKPLALMKTRPSTAGDSPAPSPHTPSSFTFTALSVSPRDPDQWEQRAKETRVVNEMLKESTARETLQDEIEDLKRMNETLRKKVQNAKNEDVGRVYLGDSTVSGLNEKKTPLTAKVDAYERKISVLQGELQTSQSIISGLHLADVDSPRTKEAYNRYVLFKNSANDLVQERTGLRTELETIKVKHGDYIQKMEKLLEQAVEQAGKTANVENEHQVERKLKEERALYKIVLDDLNERLSVEQETHAAATASNCTLQSEIAELKASLDEAKTAEFEAIRYQEDLIKRKDLELKDIRGVLSSLQHELQNLHESRQSELDAKLSELSQEHEKVIADLRAKHEDALSSMSEERLASMVHESNATEESKRELKAFLQSEIDTLKKDKASLEDSLNQQLAEVHAAKQSLQEELKLEREARDVALQAREEDNQELVRASEETQRAAASSAEKNISLQKEIDQCKETIETLKTARAVAQDEIHRLNASDDAHVQKIEELKRQLRQKDTDSKKDGKTAEQWKQAYSIMNKEHADGLSDLQKLMESLQEAQQALREKEVNTSDLREQIAGYSGQLGLLQSQMTEKEGRIRVLGTELLSSQENLKSAKAQLDAVRLPRENREDYSRSTSPSKKQIRQLRKSRSKLLEKDLSNDSMASKNDNTESERNMSPEDKSTMTESVSSEVQKSLKSAEEKNRSLEEQLEKAQDVADAKSTKLNEIEALLKVTAAELTELKTNRIKRTAAESEARASSPKPPKTPSTPTRKVTPLRSSGWALGDRTNQNEDGGNSLQGTMAGLQAQVKHIEDINEEMMGDSFRMIKMLNAASEPGSPRPRIAT